ncbi:hypothetical protein PLICRDRAFT_176520 [Plicaturopsis crispa FD-325 SS-3]|nr:hypothetical protein PLICRDRAFT_176520 [Plicaturopsis crispa FD-325 SS-3]
MWYVLKNSPVDANTVSPSGRALIADTRDIVETARLIDFVWHTRRVDPAGAKKDPADLRPVDGEKALDDGQIAVQHPHTILSLVLTNSKVRKLLSDFTLIGRDLAHGTSKAAGSLARMLHRRRRRRPARPIRHRRQPACRTKRDARRPSETVERHPREVEMTVRHMWSGSYLHEWLVALGVIRSDYERNRDVLQAEMAQYCYGPRDVVNGPWSDSQLKELIV